MKKKQLFNLLTPEGQILAIKKEPDLLRYFDEKEQTEDMCLTALKVDGLALAHVKNKTRKLCEVAIKKNPLALIFVESLDKDLVLKAASLNGEILSFIETDDYEILSTAIKQNPYAIRFVLNPEEKLCNMAVRKEPLAIRFIVNPKLTTLKIAIQKDPINVFKALSPENRNKMCLLALQTNPDIMLDISQYVDLPVLQAIISIAYPDGLKSFITENEEAIVKKIQELEIKNNEDTWTDLINNPIQRRLNLKNVNKAFKAVYSRVGVGKHIQIYKQDEENKNN